MTNSSNLYSWELVFSTLSNINRLKILEILTNEKELSVSRIADKLNISLKATSRHLRILANVQVLKGVGKKGRVYYTLALDIPKKFKRVLNLFL